MKPEEIPPVGSKVVLRRFGYDQKGTIMSGPHKDYYAVRGTSYHVVLIIFRRYRERIPIKIPIADIVSCKVGWS